MKRFEDETLEEKIERFKKNRDYKKRKLIVIVRCELFGGDETGGCKDFQRISQTFTNQCDALIWMWTYTTAHPELKEGKFNISPSWNTEHMHLPLTKLCECHADK